ncbi:hypothetical protein BDV10DRAFT_166118 [Aspergillus recurvatus]
MLQLSTPWTAGDPIQPGISAAEQKEQRYCPANGDGRAGLGAQALSQSYRERVYLHGVERSFWPAPQRPLDPVGHLTVTDATRTWILAVAADLRSPATEACALHGSRSRRHFSSTVFLLGKYTAKPKRRHGFQISFRQPYFRVDTFLSNE